MIKSLFALAGLAAIASLGTVSAQAQETLAQSPDGAPTKTAVLQGTSPHFTTPGWYVTEDTVLGRYVHSGPYKDENSCTPAQPPESQFLVSACEYLNEKPEWDN
jgi:hypothetical protein